MCPRNRQWLEKKARTQWLKGAPNAVALSFCTKELESHWYEVH